MNFCPNCGCKLQAQAKFCVECGTRIGQPETKSFFDTKSRFIPSSESRTCNYCGTPLNSFSGTCPGCGREIINNAYASACQKLCDKLEELERSRPRESVLSTITDVISMATDKIRLKTTDKQILEAVSGFVVPNTKADIMEFLMLAETKMDSSYLGNDKYDAMVHKNLCQAWKTKHNQVLSKAELILGSDPDFIMIRDNYRFKAYIKNGLCRYCGGNFKGIFNKVCQDCGKPKDY